MGLLSIQGAKERTKNSWLLFTAFTILANNYLLLSRALYVLNKLFIAVRIKSSKIHKDVRYFSF
ncbi:hypothetical protein FN961_15765 [Shewanella hanedai]|uniref:Uncharacterized protein n=1 Tax=Shewanella hanedai TaxID=25 RepID=A0A553JLH3_SHEHA|nr:hypothetical protein FN961_15765 [Shewanella hanedai]